MAAPVGYTRRVVAPWARPSDWPALPGLSPTGQAFYGLYAVTTNNNNGGGNYITLQLTCSNGAAGAISWGDGNTTAISGTGSAVTYYYQYTNPSNIPSGILNEGYYAALVSATLTTGNLTGVNLRARTNLIANSMVASSWLDITVGSPNLTSILFSGTLIPRMLQNVTITSISPSLTSFNSLFLNCTALKNVSIASSSSVVDFTNMFYGCTALAYINPFDTSAPTVTFTGSISGTTLTTTTSQSFAYGAALSGVGVPAGLYITAGGGTSWTVSASQTVASTTMLAGSNFNGIFFGCSSLLALPMLNTANVINFSGICYQCPSLEYVPLWNTQNGSNFNSSFGYCYSLIYFPLWNFSSVINAQNMFYDCYSLQMVGALVLSSSITNSGIFFTCPSLASAPTSGAKYSISFSGCLLGTPDLYAAFSGLSASPASSQTITITGNPGEASGTSCTISGNVLTVGGTVTNTWLPGMQVMAANDGGGPTLSGTVYYTIQPYGSGSTTGTGGAGTYALTATGSPGNVTTAKTIYGVPGNTNVIIGNGWGIAS